MADAPKTFVVALTGGSGMPYARRLLEVLVDAGHRLHLVASPTSADVSREELGVTFDVRDGPGLCRALLGREPASVTVHSPFDFAVPIASGSYAHDGMVVVPCSTGTLGAIANGISQHLVHRAAEVCLKERRRLILVPRETPLSAIVLENCLTLTRAGAIVLPAMPGFYHRPKTVEDMIDFVVARILDHLGVPQSLAAPYGQSLDTRVQE